MARRALGTALVALLVGGGCGPGEADDGGIGSGEAGECPELVLDDDLRIESAEGVASTVLNVDPTTLPLYTHVTGSVTVDSAGALEHLDFLRCLSSVDGSLYIVGNPDLKSLAGLERVETVGEDFDVTANPRLESLAGLENLRTIGDYALIDRNLELKTVALPALELVRELEIGLICGSENRALTEISDLRSLRGGHLNVWGHQNLVSIEGLRVPADQEADRRAMRMQFYYNERLPIAHIHDVLDPAVDAGMLLLTCGNQDDETCGDCVVGP